ncbi:MAG TPA: hypothetical protein VFA42_07985 [Gaiellaceae bacterium]|nr:hypothetical protein [Gaiellaceae bacterium]
MRTTLVMFVHLVAFAALAVLVSAAAAMPVPGRPTPTSTTHATKPVPARVVAPKTAAMLPGSTYPWVYPVWARVGGILLPTLSRTIQVGNAQPPVWIPIGR